MRRINISLLLFAWSLLPGKSWAQEMLGATLGNYAGINSAQLNPSALHNSKQYLDVQLIGMDVFLDNNYLYQAREDYSFWNFFKPGYKFPVHMEDYGTEERIFYTRENGRNKNLYINGRINGPGAMIIYNRHAFALTTAIRNNMSVTSLPQNVANFIYLGLNYVPQQNINYIINHKFGTAFASWGELGLTYSYILYQSRYDRFAVGASVKRLFGLAGGYVAVDQMDYIVPDDSTMIINNLNARTGFSLPLDYSTNEFVSGDWVKGGGFGFDVGFTYTKLVRSAYRQSFRKPCEAQYDDYLYRVGVALVDVGRIRFKKNAEEYSIDNRSSYWWDVNDFDFESIRQFMDTVSYQFYGDYTSAYRGNVIKVWLPSALSIQVDYHYQGPWYVNASLIYGFRLSERSVKRPSQLSLTPRYETGWFEASLPLTLYDWYLPRVGLALRFYMLTIGTEKLGQFFHFRDFTGLDFYFSLKIPIDKGSCGPKGPGGCPAMDKAPSIKKKKRKS